MSYMQTCAEACPVCPSCSYQAIPDESEAYAGPEGQIQETRRERNAMKHAIGMLRALRGRIPETMRSRIAYAMADVVTEGVEAATDDNALRWWRAKGRQQFFMDCGLTQDPQTTPDAIHAPPTALAKYINRWRLVTKYKDGEEFKDLTQEMHALITTMMEDLEEVADENHCV